MGEPAPSWSEFASAFELFRDPIVCGVLAGVVLGYLGVFVVLRRMVFVTAAISQSAGLGVALAFYAQIHLGQETAHPVAGALALSVLATLLFAAQPERLRVSRESLLGLAYVAAGAAAVIVGDRITQESHDISAILFGTAVLVRPEDLRAVLGVGLFVTAIHLWWHRGFLFAAFDPDGARVHGLPVRLLDTVLWLLVALEVSVTTRALGALPVFAFAVLPAMAALMASGGLRGAFPLAALLGGIAGGAGYVLAYFLSTPVGATQVVVAASLVVLALPIRAVRGRA